MTFGLLSRPIRLILTFSVLVSGAFVVDGYRNYVDVKNKIHKKCNQIEYPLTPDQIKSMPASGDFFPFTLQPNGEYLWCVGSGEVENFVNVNDFGLLEFPEHKKADKEKINLILGVPSGTLSCNDLENQIIARLFSEIPNISEGIVPGLGLLGSVNLLKSLGRSRSINSAILFYSPLNRSMKVELNRPAADLLKLNANFNSGSSLSEKLAVVVERYEQFSFIARQFCEGPRSQRQISLIQPEKVNQLIRDVNYDEEDFYANLNFSVASLIENTTQSSETKLMVIDFSSRTSPISFRSVVQRLKTEGNISSIDICEFEDDLCLEDHERKRILLVYFAETTEKSVGDLVVVAKKFLR